MTHDRVQKRSLKILILLGQQKRLEKTPSETKVDNSHSKQTNKEKKQKPTQIKYAKKKIRDNQYD